MPSIANHLLSALPGRDYQRLFSGQRPVMLAAGQILYDCGDIVAQVYFPTGCLISLLCTMENGATAETGLVGNDGMVGVSLFLGGETAPNRAVTLIPGRALRLGSGILRSEFARNAALQKLLLRYTQAFLTQISQTAACNRLHSVEQRLCRWLLLCHDRISSDQLPMTQQGISQILGARRESVALAAARLQRDRLIHYSRGHIQILDRRGLEATACECYLMVKTEVNRLYTTEPQPLYRSSSAL